MIFHGVDNQTVELKITGYQYSNYRIDYIDDVWLNIYLHVNSNVGHWHTIDPSLTIMEFRELKNWFFILSKNEKPKYSDMRFIEPNLTFELLNEYDSDQKRFRIKFGAESRPKSAEDNEVYFVDCLADCLALRRIAEELQTELDIFPKSKLNVN